MNETGRSSTASMHMLPGGGHGSFNHRFAEPSRDASPFDLFLSDRHIPFTDVELDRSETGETDGLLTLTAAQKVLPKIFYTNSSYEYWAGPPR
jgi:hypothetical protein